MLLFLIVFWLIGLFVIRRWVKDWDGIWIGIHLIVGTVITVLAFIAWMNHAAFPPAQAKLTEIRSSVERLGCSASEDVLGTAMRWNTDLISSKYWNKRWIGDSFLHDGVDTTTLITIPVCR